jgi:hypothetical protein
MPKKKGPAGRTGGAEEWSRHDFRGISLQKAAADQPGLFLLCSCKEKPRLSGPQDNRATPKVSNSVISKG